MPVLSFIVLGAFWGVSPSMYKLMAADGMPITHIIVWSALGVGIGLAVVAKLRDGLPLFADRRLIFYGLGCGVLLNIPMALQIMFAAHVPAAELAVIFSTAPFFNYMLALVLGRDRVQANKILALMAGFAASALLILTREGAEIGAALGWTLATFVCPVLYAFYNLFTSTQWPEGADVARVGMAESFGSALVALPFLLVLAMPGVVDLPPPVAWWPLALLTVMWVAERLVYFWLIREKGPVYTIQAIYVAAPAGVLYGMLIFGERPDVWLYASLAGVVLALWLNNRPRRAVAVSTVREEPS